MPGATWRSSPHAASVASAVRFGIRAVSNSDLPVSGLGSPPSPSNDINTIFVVLAIASDRISSSMPPVYRSPAPSASQPDEEQSATLQREGRHMTEERTFRTPMLWKFAAKRYGEREGAGGEPGRVQRPVPRHARRAGRIEVHEGDQRRRPRGRRPCLAP